MLGELLDLRLVEGADHEGGKEAREHDRGVAIRLTSRELKLCGGQEERHSAELGDPDLERHTRACRGLVKDEADRATGQHAQLSTSRALRLQLVREVKEGLDLAARPGCDAREAASL